MRRLLLSTALLLTLMSTAWGKPAFDSEKRYHIACQQFAGGCVTDGATAGQQTPLYYLTQATADGATFWFFTEEEDGLYSIRNAETGQYITYDGVRQDSPQLLRYVNMTDGMDGYNTLWSVVLQSEGVYVIRNAGQSDHIWDVRVDSYCVGTYSNSSQGNSNQRFMFYDEQGNQVSEQAEEPEEPETPATPEGINVSSWLAATTESPEGWTFETGSFSNPGFGNYHNGTASVVAPFLERWQDSSWGPLPDNAMKQTLENLPKGTYTLTADIIAVLQPTSGWWGSISEETGYGVYLFADNNMIQAGTRNERPQHYSVDFVVDKTGKATVGLRIEDTNANWVAIDNVQLYYQGSSEDLLAAEKERVAAALADYYTATEIAALIEGCGDDFAALESLLNSVANLPPKSPISVAYRNLIIDQQEPTYVKSIETFLQTLPLSQFGQAYEAVITYDKQDGWDDLTINGSTVPSGQSYTFREVTGGKQYLIRAKKSDGSETLKFYLTFTSLPVVRLYGTFSNDYSEGSIFVQEPGNEQLPMFNMKAKWRGGITNSNGKNKRNYHVKLKDAAGEKLEHKFFGLRNDNSWILESCQVDMSRIRNRMLTDLWNDYSVKPYYISQEPKAKTGTRGRFVELILNDEYRGIYCMTENMDRKQMKLKKYDEATQTQHGQLWKSKDWSYATFMGTRPDGGYYPKDYLSDPNGYSDMWDSYQMKYPDTEDVLPADWETLYNAVDFVCHSTDEDFREHFTEYFDLPVVIDYYILMETILSTDNHGKNMFFAVYDKQQDKRITFGVWDMDATCGQRWSDQYYHDTNLMNPERDYAEFISRYEHGDYNLFKRLRDNDVENFNMRVRLRYRDLRKTYLSTDAILARFEKQLNEFKTAGAAQREYDRWNYNSDIAGHELDFDNEMEYLTDWFTRRMNYLDTTRFDIASLPSATVGDANGDSTIDVADVVAIVNYILNNPDEKFVESAADVNEDGVIDVADVVAVVNIILNDGNSNGISE